MYCIEKVTGEVKINTFNHFIKDTMDMEDVEYWEDRLDFLGQPYLLVFRYVDGQALYSFFVNSKHKESKFK